MDKENMRWIQSILDSMRSSFWLILRHPWATKAAKRSNPMATNPFVPAFWLITNRLANVAMNVATPIKQFHLTLWPPFGIASPKKFLLFISKKKEI